MTPSAQASQGSESSQDSENSQGSESSQDSENSQGSESSQGAEKEPVGPPAAGRGRRALPGRRLTVLAGTAASAALAGATRTLWVRASGPDLTGTSQQVDVLGADAAPAVLALALVAIAGSLATSLSSTWVRFLTGPVLLLTGGGAVLAALGVVRDPVGAASSAVTTATGLVGSAIGAESTVWPLLSLVPALAVMAVGVLVLLAGGSWPRRDRYRSAAVAATGDPSEDPAAAWDALTRGEDPSARDETGPDVTPSGR